MAFTLNLLPYPQAVNTTGGAHTLPETGHIVLDVPRAADYLFIARRAQAALAHYAGINWEITGSSSLPAALAITLDETIEQAQGYRLTIDSEHILIAAKDGAGAFYGVMTLSQLLQTHVKELPQLIIDDWPDFPSRGVMLDISRDKVPTMETLYNLVDLLASWKVNQFQLYIEHTFAYHGHETVWKDASPMTAEQILELDAYCRERFVELVPNQNSFGHLHRWFRHERYLPLAETETGVETPWGTVREHPFSLSPAVPEGLDFLEDLYAQFLPNFTSDYFNVGCDETFDLGMGRSKDLVEKQGKGRVYLDFLLEIYQRVKAHHRTMQFWGDIINQYPDLVPELPKDVVALEWGYEATHDYPGKTRLFGESGIPFYVCPGTSSWTSIAGRTDNCIGNIRNAAENGLQNGAIGLLNTDWGDLGHWQPLPVSYLGFAYGAALSWAFEQNVNVDISAVLDTFVFHDDAGVMGQLAYDLGNAYQQPGVLIPNGSLLFWVYHRSIGTMQERFAQRLNGESQSQLKESKNLRDALQATIEYIDNVMVKLDDAKMTRSDVELIKREFTHAAKMLKHGAKRGLLQLGDDSVDKETLLAELDAIIEEHRHVWLARNRPGGLNDSTARLEAARSLYMDK